MELIPLRVYFNNTLNLQVFVGLCAVSDLMEYVCAT